MPTEIIIPKHHRHRRHSSVGYHRGTSSAYRHGVPAQTYVTGPATGMQYATNVPFTTTPYIAPTTTPYVASATPMVSTTPLVQPQAINYAPTVQTQTVQPTAVSAIATPMVTTNALPRPISAPPIAGSVYGDPNGMGGVGYAGAGAYGDPYGYHHSGSVAYYGHRARPGYDIGYGYGGGGGGGIAYDGRYPVHEGGYGYPGAGSAYEYYGDTRAPFNQRVAGSLEQLGGYLVDSPDMVARGYARRTGYPVVPSTAQDAARRGMVGYGGVRYVPGVGPTYL